LGPADEEMEVEGTPNEIQEALMRSAAQRIGVEIRRILPSD
jgi:hypothetical protein